MGFWSSLFGFDDKPAPPTVVQQTSKIPEELAPFVKEILGEAQTLYGAQKEEGYQPYTEDTIAPLTPEEIKAQEGLAGLAGYAYQDTGKVDDAGEPIKKLVRTGPGVTQPYLQEALDIYRTGAEKFTPEAAQEYMSPYQRAVTDIEKREAQKVFERDIMPRFEQQAVQAGGMSGLGSRAAIQAGQLGQAQMQQLGDIEAKGLQRAYMDAQKLYADQKARERQSAGDIATTGPAMLQAGLAEQGILQDIGQQKRDMGQAALDEAYYRFLKEQAYPQDILASYSGTTYGASPFVGPSGTITKTGGQPRGPSPGQQLLGLGLQGLNIYGMAGGFGSKGPSWGTLGKSMGYPMKAGGGLSNILPPEISIEDSINIEMQNPEKRRGRPAEIYGTEAEIARKRLDAERDIIKSLWQQKDSGIKNIREQEQAGIDATKRMLEEAAKQRTESRTDLEDKLKGIERRGPGIKGIADATTGKRQSIWSALTQIGDETMRAAQKYSTEEAKREADRIGKLSDLERTDLEKQIAAQLTTTQEEGKSKTKETSKLAEAAVAANTAYGQSRLNNLDTVAKNKLKKIVADHDLSDKITNWPSEKLDKLLDLAKKKLDIKKQRNEIEKLKAETIAETKGTKIKPAVYGQIRNNFEALLKTGIISGISDGKGGFIINKIKGQSITPTESKRIAKVLSDATKMIDEGDLIGKVTDFMANEIYGIAGVDPKKPKTKTKVDPNDPSTYIKGETQIKNKDGVVVGTWDGNNFIDADGEIVK